MNFRTFLLRPLSLALTLGAAFTLPALADDHGMGDAMAEPMMDEPMMNEPMMQNPVTDSNLERIGPSIVSIATSNGDFDTLTRALRAANLVEILQQPGPYTVFAPTDQAFDELPEGALEFLLQPENQDLLRQVLTYHVVPGEVVASELSTGGIDALSGGIAVRVTDDRVIINNGSVIIPDIEADNGVVHAINRVLIPSRIRQQLLAQLEQ